MASFYERQVEALRAPLLERGGGGGVLVPYYSPVRTVEGDIDGAPDTFDVDLGAVAVEVVGVVRWGVAHNAGGHVLHAGGLGGGLRVLAVAEHVRGAAVGPGGRRS